MKRIWSFCILLVLLFTQSACNFPTPRTSPVPIPLPTPTIGTGETHLPVDTQPPEPTFTGEAGKEPASGPINLELLKNFTYWIEDFGKQVTLIDGAFSDDEIHSWLVEPVALGDLNGDGRTDAAAVLVVDPSGSGTFYDLTAVLDQNGSPVQAGFNYIGDRQVIKNLEIVDGRIVLDFLTQDLNDPSCCPSEHRLRSYLLENGKLLLASEQVLDSPEARATPLPNAILIDQPLMFDPITNPLQVRGRVSQVPSEKKLAYYVIDLSATLLAQGEVPLEGEPGGPGGFAFEFSLDSPSPGWIQLELVDAADGILRGRSIVILIERPGG